MRILYVNILWLLSSGVLSDNPAQNQDERLVLSYNENSSENGTVEIVGMKRNNYDQGLCRSQFKELFDRFNSGDTWARKGTYIYCFINVIRNRISYAIPKFLQMLGFHANWVVIVQSTHLGQYPYLVNYLKWIYPYFGHKVVNP